METTLSFLPPLPCSCWFVSLRNRNGGLLLCNTGAVGDSSPQSRVRPASQGTVSVSVSVCVSVCSIQNYLGSAAAPRKGHKISCPHLSPDSLSMKCFSVLESGTHVRKCVCVCFGECEHAPCRLCYPSDSVCLSYDRGG